LWVEIQDVPFDLIDQDKESHDALQAVDFERLEEAKVTWDNLFSEKIDHEVLRHHVLELLAQEEFEPVEKDVLVVLSQL
jgi:hypothetical protein